MELALLLYLRKELRILSQRLVGVIELNPGSCGTLICVRECSSLVFNHGNTGVNLLVLAILQSLMLGLIIVLLLLHLGKVLLECIAHAFERAIDDVRGRLYYLLLNFLSSTCLNEADVPLVCHELRDDLSLLLTVELPKHIAITLC